MVKRRHPMRCNPDRFLSGDESSRRMRARFKHAFKLSSILGLEPVAEEFFGARVDRRQEAGLNCGDKAGEISSGCDLSGQVEFEGDLVIHRGTKRRISNEARAEIPSCNPGLRLER
jgi:hypothetical protein